MDLVGLRVGPSCLRMDSDETLPAFKDERSVLSIFDLDAALDGRPMDGVLVLEPLEHLVLEMALDGRPMEGRPVLEPLEHSVLVIALNGGSLKEMLSLESLEHTVLNVALDGGLIEEMTVLEPIEQRSRKDMCCGLERWGVNSPS